MPEEVINRNQSRVQTSWQDGMITSLPAEELPPTAAQDLVNVEIDIEGNIVTRTGALAFIQPSTTSRITSIFRAQYSNGTVLILFTAGTKLFKCNEDGSSITDITGALTLPNNTMWQWAMFGDLAIGVNKATSGDNPVKVNNAGTAAALGGSPPKAKYIRVWNERVWLATSTGGSQNQLRASAINLPEDWSTTGDAGTITINVDANDGDFITGLEVFRGSLFVFKRRKINVVSPIAAPATIPGNLRVDVFTKNLGCVSAYSIQPVLDDIVFLADCGVVSLSQSEFGELKSAILSQNIAELNILKKTSALLEEIPAFVLDDVNQYWLSIPSTISPRGVNEIYVMDYQRIKEGLIRWVRFNGLICGTAFAEKLDGDYKTYLIGAYTVASVNTKIYKYSPSNPTKTFADDGGSYLKLIKTKAYIGETPMIRQLWNRFGCSLNLISELLSFVVNYFYNNNVNVDGDYSFNFIFSGIAPPLYGTAIYGTNTYGSASDFFREEVIWERFKKNENGRKARTVSFEFSNSQTNQGFVFKFLQVDYTKLTRKNARTI
jgi:hypothetical protein